MNIGILGSNSYIGNSFFSFLAGRNDINIERISSRTNEWENKDFSQFDVLLCTVGIAHISQNPSMESLYYEINRDLPVSLAKKAKTEGVKQFVFLSSMIVYGNDKSLGIPFSINIDTKENPDSFYGKSKLEAESLLQQLADDDFTVLIVRLPMVYGPGCKGNFPKLLQIAKKMPLCPLIENQRSMIYIDNLCEYLYQSIITKKGGIDFPQNEEYVSTTQVIKIASSYYHHKIFFTKIFNPLIYFLSRKLTIINRIYGTKVYDKSLSPNMKKYNSVDFLTSIKKCIDS